MRLHAIPAAALAALLVGGVSFAGDPPAAPSPAPDRPSEEDLFGNQPAAQPDQKKQPEQKAPETPAQTPPVAPAHPPEENPVGTATQGGSEGANAHAPPSAEEARDQLNLGAPGAPTRLSSEVAPDNPLTIGGQFYLRSQSTALQNQDPQNWSFSAPSLLDAYFDARPNNRVRGFVLGRMEYDPTLPPQGSAPSLAGATAQPSGSTMGLTPLSSLTAGMTRGPQVLLDQMWLRFDIKHTVFVTAGKQHVRWGTARFWTPTDFLHLTLRNPLDVFDARTGTTMLKLHVPWESTGWNFYGYALTEGVDATPTVGDIAAAARAELVVDTVEAGFGALVQRGHRPKLAADVSAGVFDFDVYGEAALRFNDEIDRVGFDPAVALSASDLATISAADLGILLDRRYPVYRRTGVSPQVVGGLSYSAKYAANDVVTIGAEYFYNGLGYDDSRVYPGLIVPRNLSNAATFFYLGKQYGAVFVSLPSPWSWDLHSFTLSTLGNLSDHSFISRLDYALVLLTHLRFEAFFDVRYGHDTGEFRFGIPELGRAPGLLDMGVALRVSI